MEKELFNRVFNNSVVSKRIYDCFRGTGVGFDDICSIDWVIRNKHWALLAHIVKINHYLQLKESKLVFEIISVDVDLFKSVFNRYKENHFVVPLSTTAVQKSLINQCAVEYFLEQGYQFNSDCYAEAWRVKNYHMVKYIFGQLQDKKLDFNIQQAILSNNFDILGFLFQYVNENNIFCDPESITCYFQKALETDSIEMFKTLLQQYPQSFCPEWFKNAGKQNVQTTKKQDLIVYILDRFSDYIKSLEKEDFFRLVGYFDLLFCNEKVLETEKTKQLGIISNEQYFRKLKRLVSFAFIEQDQDVLNKYKDVKIDYQYITISDVKVSFYNLEKIRQLHALGCKFQRSCAIKVIEQDNLPIFKIIVEIEPQIIPLSYHIGIVFQHMAKNIFNYLKETGIVLKKEYNLDSSQGIKWNMDENLDFVKEVFNEYTLDETSIFTLYLWAIAQGSVKTLEYLNNSISNKSGSMIRSIYLFQCAFNKPYSSNDDYLVQALKDINISYNETVLANIKTIQQVKILFKEPFIPVSSNLFTNLSKQLPKYSVFKFIFEKLFIDVKPELVKEVMSIAINSNQVCHFKFLLDHYHDLFSAGDLDAKIIYSGNLEIFKYFLNRFPINNDNKEYCFKIAINSSNLDIIKFFVENIDSTLLDKITSSIFNLGYEQNGFSSTQFTNDWFTKKGSVFIYFSKLIDKEILNASLNNWKNQLLSFQTPPTSMYDVFGGTIFARQSQLYITGNSSTLKPYEIVSKIESLLDNLNSINQ
ncbi:hypothetical protein CYY_009604 [Polysphondylium violaceum]|uniref:Uncharacterized protein n=1 Tax=Polysphondylium violaceum TaxID=133409 RepID=A0A8J4UPD6_9MYCE|nr:hypothetical protein CYY_009604 [Polysphondylium violaceum]